MENRTLSMSAESHRRKHRVPEAFALAIALILGLSPSCGMAQTSPGEYSDKNQYFTFLPPDGWKTTEYPNDPRSKVQFDNPNTTGVFIRLIAAAAPPHMKDANFLELMNQDLQNLKARAGAGISMHLTPDDFAGYPAAYVRQSGPGLEQELTLFLANNVFFNIAFSAPTKSSLDRSPAVVQKSLGTIVVKGAPTREAAREQQIARYLRLAQLLANIKNFAGAKSYLDEALQGYPGDPRLERARRLVEQGQPIPDDLGPGALSGKQETQPFAKTPPEPPQDLATELYSDRKGFFQIRPPAGWSINEYPDDPRGKVDFRIPPTGDWRQGGAELKVIALLNAPGRDIAAARTEIEGSAERLRARLGASVEVTETTLLGVPAVRVRIDQPGKLRQEAIEVLIKPNRYSFTIGAPPHRWDQYYPVAMKSIETLLPILRDLPKEEAIRHLLASHIRRAELYRQMGQRAWALEAVDEGLRLDPSNDKLLQMKRDLENR